MSHTLIINCTCKNRLGCSLLPFTFTVSYIRGSIDQKHSKTNEIWRQNSEIHPAFACSCWPLWFPDLSRPYGACVKRGSGKHMFGLSLFHPSRQSNISTSGEERFKYPLPWENKITWMPYPRTNQDNQIPTPCPASSPPAPAGIIFIGALDWLSKITCNNLVKNDDATIYNNDENHEISLLFGIRHTSLS